MLSRVVLALALVASASGLAAPVKKAVAPAAKVAAKPVAKAAPKVVAAAKPVAKAAPKPVVKAAPKPVVKAAPKAAAPKVVSSFASALGAMPPTGFWDPAGLASKIDEATFDKYRTAELKHGRICQLAIIGYLVPEFYRFPGYIAPGLKFADVPHGIAAISTIPSFGMIQIFFAIGAVDYWGILGDFSVGKIGSSISQGGILNVDDATATQRKTQELAHGRLAMLGFLELLRHDSQNFVAHDDPTHFIIGLATPY